jgi:hypothetical protein
MSIYDDNLEAKWLGRAPVIDFEGSPSREINRQLRADAILCEEKDCGFARAITWGTPEAPAFFNEAVYFHLIDHPGHSLTYPKNVWPGLRFLSMHEKIVGAAYMKGYDDGKSYAADRFSNLSREIKTEPKMVRGREPEEPKGDFGRPG